MLFLHLIITEPHTEYLSGFIKGIWQYGTWSRLAHFSSTTPPLDPFSGTMKSSAVVGKPASTATRSWSSLIPVTFNNKINIVMALFGVAFTGFLPQSVILPKVNRLKAKQGWLFASYIICLSTSHCRHIRHKSAETYKFNLTDSGKDWGF